MQVLVAGAFIAFVVAGALSDQNDNVGNTGGSGGSTSELSAWSSQNVSRIDSLSAALGGLSNGGVSGISAQCEILRQAVQRAELGLPVPDETIDRYYTDALDNFARAADICAQPHTTAEGLQLATSYINQGRISMDLATASIP